MTPTISIYRLDESDNIIEENNYGCSVFCHAAGPTVEAIFVVDELPRDSRQFGLFFTRPEWMAFRAFIDAEFEKAIAEEE